MSNETVGAATLPVRWADVLDQVAQALAQTEAEAARAEELPPVSSTSDPDRAWQEALLRLGERLQQLDTCVAQAGQAAEQVEAALQGSESALRRWLAEAEAVRGRLAKGASSAVS
jgi:predicted Rossmann fold nucleotide-binding protein DprA/Smf involved in DNA uptake